MVQNPQYDQEKIEVKLKRHVELELDISDQKKVIVNLLDHHGELFELNFIGFTDKKENYFVIVKLENSKVSEIEIQGQYPDNVTALLIRYVHKVEKYLQKAFFESEEITGWKTLKLFDDRLK